MAFTRSATVGLTDRNSADEAMLAKTHSMLWPAPTFAV